jgi:hypothetical protein
MIQFKVIKGSSGNNMEVTSISFNEELPQPAVPKNEADSQVVATKENANRTETESKEPPGKQLSYELV